MIERIYGFSAEAGLYPTFWNKLQMLIVETDSLHPGGNHHEHKLYRAITFFGACGLYLGYIKAPLLALKIIACPWNFSLWTIFKYLKKTLTGELYRCDFPLKILRYWLLLVPNFCRKKKKCFCVLNDKIVFKEHLQAFLFITGLGNGRWEIYDRC